MGREGRITNLAEFRELLGSGRSPVITDTATGDTFHSDPAGCPHVQEAYFTQKVIENGERSGSYYAIASLVDARRRWPEVPSCSFCSSSTS